jgi:hypothetical protein
MAADINGYTAQYECRAGNPNCDVDVVGLTNRNCDQTISPSTPWSSINWSNKTICIAAGDHRSKGTLTIPASASGSSGNYRVLRYFRSGDNNDEPWNQSAADRAVLHSINLTGTNYWIIHRLTIDRNETRPAGSGALGIKLGDDAVASEYNIINRVLIQKLDATGVAIDRQSRGDVVQNSVIRTLVPYPNDQWVEHMCIDINHSTNAYIVNNELYDCDKGVSAGDGSFADGAIVENNDIYLSLAGRTDCNGNYTSIGECSGYMENGISLKSSGSRGNPTQIIHNRMWGCRWGDSTVSQSGDCALISISANAQGGSSTYTVVKNNVLFDSDLGIWNYHGTGTAPANPHHNSFIGNLIYDIRNHRPSHPQELAGALMYRDIDNSEYYLNTVVDATYWFVSQGYGTNNDVRCNVAINSGGQSGGVGSGTQFDNNAFYATPLFTTNQQTSNNIARSSVSDSANTDYCFSRKLRTAPEQFCIPHARSTAASPHYQACDKALGSRQDIGINDSLFF